MVGEDRSRWMDEAIALPPDLMSGIAFLARYSLFDHSSFYEREKPFLRAGKLDAQDSFERGDESDNIGRLKPLLGASERSCIGSQVLNQIQIVNPAQGGFDREKLVENFDERKPTPQAA